MATLGTSQRVGWPHFRGDFVHERYLLEWEVASITGVLFSGSNAKGQRIGQAMWQFQLHYIFNT